ncbi:MAG: hypothetical protein Q8P41_11920 [Pseudomonadota bacterium]|nr:hypothetical protein [Pseudomonadota bacterium]
MQTALLALLLACTGDPPGVEPDPDDEPCTIADVDLVEVFHHVIDGEADACDIDAFTEFVDARTAASGPWKQDVRMAWSEDAVLFTPLDGVVVETAAVPEIVLHDGRYWLYHVDGRYDHAVELAREGSTWMQTHGVPGLGALSLAVSDDGRTFTKVEEFEVIGVVRGMVVDPDVVRQPDGTWRMYYVGMTAAEYLTGATWEYPEEHEVYWASSPDLVHWTQEGALFRGPFADPSVSCSEGDQCIMASFGLQWSRSTNGGTEWAHEGEWGVDGFAPEITRFVDGSRRMFFNTRALGADLLSFDEDEEGVWEFNDTVVMPDLYGEAVTLAPAQPSGWWMWFHTFKDPDDQPF